VLQENRLFRASAGAAPVTALHIGPRHTRVASGSGACAERSIALEIGWARTAREFFRHDPPAPAELEAAITAIEDEVARARSIVAAGSVLSSNDARLRELAHAAGLGAGEHVLRLEAVEQLYQRLAARSLGALPSADELLASPAGAATVLILRELMHHLGCAALHIRTPDPASDSREDA